MDRTIQRLSAEAVCINTLARNAEADYIEGVMVAHEVRNPALYGIARRRLQLQRTARELRRALQ